MKTRGDENKPGLLVMEKDQAAFLGLKKGVKRGTGAVRNNTAHSRKTKNQRKADYKRMCEKKRQW